MKTTQQKIKEEKKEMFLLNIFFAFAGAILLGFIYSYANEIAIDYASLSEISIFNSLFVFLIFTIILFLFIPIIAYNTNAVSKACIRDLKNKLLNEKGFEETDELSVENLDKFFKNEKITSRILFAFLAIILFYIGYFHAQNYLNGFVVDIKSFVLYLAFVLVTGINFIIFEKIFKKSNINNYFDIN